MSKRSHAATGRRQGCALARVAVATGVVALALVAWFGGPASAVAEPSFSISGSASGLAPGVRTELPVTIGNPSGQPITVSSVRATAADASAECPASNFVSLGAGGPVVIPAHGQSQQALPVALAADAPIACQGMTFPLTLSGVAGPAATHLPAHHDTFAFLDGSARAALSAAAIASLGAGFIVLARRRAGGTYRALA